MVGAISKLAAGQAPAMFFKVLHGVGILMDKLGPVETSRFLAMHQAGKLDSVKRHHRWQSELDKEDFFKEIFG